MIEIVLIGGHDFLTKDRGIENEIIRVSKKTNPKVLFIPFADSNIDSSTYKFRNYFDSFDFVSQNEDNLFKLMQESDIIYFGAGNARNLVQISKKLKIDEMIKSLINTDKIFAGISAGAIMFSKYGMGDSESFLDNFHSFNYKMVEGLGILPLTICPHYQKEDLTVFNDDLKDYPFSAFALEDDTAVFINKNTARCFKSNLKNSTYFFDYNADFKMSNLVHNETIEWK